MKKLTKKERLKAAAREIALAGGLESEIVRRMLELGRTQTLFKKPPKDWERTCFRVCVDTLIIEPYLRRDKSAESYLHYEAELEYLIDDFHDRWNFRHCPKATVQSHETALSPSKKKALRRRFRELNPEKAEADDVFRAFMAMPEGLPFEEQLRERLRQLTKGGKIEIIMRLPSFQAAVERLSRNRILFQVNREGELEIFKEGKKWT